MDYSVLQKTQQYLIFFLFLRILYGQDQHNDSDNIIKHIDSQV